mgnify:CR=1 FL=1
MSKFYTVLATACFSFLFLAAQSQVLPDSFRYEWNLAGIKDTSTAGFAVIDIANSNLAGNGVTANDNAFNQLLQTLPTSGARLVFPSGVYRFTQPLSLPSNIVLEGQGHRETTILLDLNGDSHGINITGNQTSIIDSITAPVQRDDDFLEVTDGSQFQAGDWIKITKNDSDLIFSSWAMRSVGQIIQIDNVVANTLVLRSDVRMDYSLAEDVSVRKIEPIENVGIECLNIKRLDNTAPNLEANVRYNYAVNSWMNGVQSDSCTYAHVWANNSSNLAFTSNYFHHAHDYGPGGRARGIALLYTTNEVLIENNVFDSLRHSVFLEAGVNCNVIAYNYSLNPFWDVPPPAPADAPGELVIEGNWAYANLFEGNIVRNMVVSNGHGANGPHNVFFRNRGDGFGIFMSDETSPNQAFIGNEITNMTNPYNEYNYYLQGSGHFIYGNNDKGVITPAGTDVLTDQSYYYSSIPRFLSEETYVSIGLPNELGEGTIPAQIRRDVAGVSYAAFCGNDFNTDVNEIIDLNQKVDVFPNPASGLLNIRSEEAISELTIINSTGQVVLNRQVNQFLVNLDVAPLKNGFYFVTVHLKNGKMEVRKLVKN